MSYILFWFVLFAGWHLWYENILADTLRDAQKKSLYEIRNKIRSLEFSYFVDLLQRKMQHLQESIVKPDLILRNDSYCKVVENSRENLTAEDIEIIQLSSGLDKIKQNLLWIYRGGWAIYILGAISAIVYMVYYLLILR